MPFMLRCPACEALFRLPDELAGRQLKCQNCAHVFQAPAAAARSAGEALPAEVVDADVAHGDVMDADLVDAEATGGDAKDLPMAHAIQTSPRTVPSRTAPGAGTPDYEGRGDDGRGEPRRRRAEFDEPGRGRRVYRERDDSSVAVWVALGIVGGVIFIVLAGVAAWFLLRSQPVALAPMPPPMPPNAIRKQPPPVIMFPGVAPGMGALPPVGNDRAIKIALTKGLYQGANRLDNNDPVDPTRRQFCKVFLINFEQGRHYVINVTGSPFDNYLRLEKAPGQQLMQDDDSGGFPNARIVFACNQTGEHRIIVTSFGGGIGDFTLAVRDQSIPEPAPSRPLVKLVVPEPDPVPQKLPVQDGSLGKLPVKTIQLNQMAGDICAAPDGQSFYVLQSTGMLRQVATRDLTDLKRINLPTGCRSLTMSAAGLAVAVVSHGEVWVLDPATLALKQRISVPDVQEIASAPNTTWGYALFQKNQPGLVLNQRHVSVLDLAKGASLHRQALTKFDHFAVADAQTVLAVGDVFPGDTDCLVRYRIQADGTLAREQASPRLGRSQTGIAVSRDGKYVCLPTPGGNARIGGGFGGQPPLHVFETKNLLQPAFSIAAGPFVRAAGFDAAFIYTATNNSYVAVYDYKGQKLAEHGQPGVVDMVEQVTALAPRKFVMRRSRSLVVAELGEDGREVGAPPRPKGEAPPADGPKGAVGALPTAPARPLVVTTNKNPATADEEIRAGGESRQFVTGLQAKRTYTVEVKAQGFTPQLKLRSSGGELLQEASAKEGGDVRLVYQPTRSLPARIEVSATDNSKTGRFTISIRRDP